LSGPSLFERDHLTKKLLRVRNTRDDIVVNEKQDPIVDAFHFHQHGFQRSVAYLPAVYDADRAEITVVRAASGSLYRADVEKAGSPPGNSLVVEKRVIIEVRRSLLFIEGPQLSVFEIL
jgi:hypothetical protein